MFRASFVTRALAVLVAVVTLGLAQADAQPQPQPQPDPPPPERAQAPPAQSPPAQSPPQSAVAPTPGERRTLSDTELEAMLERVAAMTGKEFVVHPGVRGISVLGTLDETPSYPVLLQILRLHGFAAVEIDGVVNIMPDAGARALATPIVQTDDPSIPGDEIVTRVIRTEHVNAAQLVPLLRPLQQQYEIIGALPDGSALILVGRYANVKRLTDIVREVDRERAGQDEP